MNNVKKAVALLLALALIFAFPVTASAAETTEARVPVTLTVVNTVSPISCTVPACLPAQNDLRQNRASGLEAGSPL